MPKESDMRTTRKLLPRALGAASEVGSSVLTLTIRSHPDEHGLHQIAGVRHREFGVRNREPDSVGFADDVCIRSALLVKIADRRSCIAQILEVVAEALMHPEFPCLSRTANRDRRRDNEIRSRPRLWIL